MSRSLRQRLRRFVPNVGVRIKHLDQSGRLEVRFREHLGLIARGAKNYEPQYVSVFRKLLTPGATVFDVGANIGFYSVLFSAWVGSRGKVVAFEPDPANLKSLRRNLQMNDCENVAVSPVALSNRSGIELFSVDPVTRLTGHLGKGATYASTIFGSGKEDLISVITSTLDQEMEKFGVPDFIKIDIEGGEHDALAGGVDLLQRHRPLIVSELSSWSETRPICVERAKQTTRLLTDFDYSLWDLDTGVRLGPESLPWMFLAVPQDKLNEGQVKNLFGGQTN
jgi:FkbM family methyltransferase